MRKEVESPSFDIAEIRKTRRGVTFELPAAWRREDGLGPICHIEPMSLGRLGIRVLARRRLPDGSVHLSLNQGEKLEMEHRYHPDTEKYYYMLVVEVDGSVTSVVVNIAVQ